MLAQAWMPRTPELDALMQGMRDAVQDYKAKKVKNAARWSAVMVAITAA